VYSLFKHSVFILSWAITGLNDSTIIVRLGGDKGGKTMAFKFGVTVMNCLQPNLPDSFDLLGTIEVFDTYLNLKTALFDHFKSELCHLCQIEEGEEPSMIVIFKKMADVKVPILVEMFSGLICNPILHEVIVIDDDLLEKNPNFFATDRGCSHVDHCSFCSLRKSDDIVGVAFIYVSGCVVGVTKLKGSIRKEELKDLMFEQFTIHLVLNADLEFLHTVLGLQSCSATYPCCLCLVRLDELRQDRSIGCGLLRNTDQMKEHLQEVNKGCSVAQKKKYAQKNGSVIREALIPISLDQIMLPILHIILGVVRKLWDNLVADIHDVESNWSQEIKMLTEARENLAKHASILAQRKENVFSNYKTAEKQQQETKQLFIAAKNQSPPLSTAELFSIQVQYELLHLKLKDALTEKKN
jgi:hypothetical protein